MYGLNTDLTYCLKKEHDHLFIISDKISPLYLTTSI